MVTLAAQLAARIAQPSQGWLQKTDWSKPLRGIAGGEWHRHGQRPQVWRPRKALNTITPRKDEDHAKAACPSRAGGGGSAPRSGEPGTAFSRELQPGLGRHLRHLSAPVERSRLHQSPSATRSAKEHWTAISAVKLISDRLIEQFKGMKDPICGSAPPMKTSPSGSSAGWCRTNRAAHHRRTRGAGRR